MCSMCISKNLWTTEYHTTCKTSLSLDCSCAILRTFIMRGKWEKYIVCKCVSVEVWKVIAMHRRKMLFVQPTDNGASWQPSAFYSCIMSTVGSMTVKSYKLRILRFFVHKLIVLGIMTLPFPHDFWKKCFT